MEKNENEWREKLTPEQFNILRKKGTEPPGSGQYLNLKDNGMFACAGCGAELFSSDTKYNSGSGWPSFTDAEEAVGTRDDDSLGMIRTEIYCKKCDGHLGHVFDDGPGPNGKRYCVNSLSLDFKKKEDN